MKKKIQWDTGAYLHLTEETGDIAGALQRVRAQVQRILAGAPAIPTAENTPMPETAASPAEDTGAAQSNARAKGTPRPLPAGEQFSFREAAGPPVVGPAPEAAASFTPIPVPALARGAVLPANRPFLAVLGDQTEGINVEAPLATIQEAVALVMADQTEAVTAGMEANLATAREILEAVRSIRIGDDLIASAGERYYRIKAMAEGGIG